ncbi:hypothetical protein CFter6_4598 [Collimonas fungivorans]|uniref:Biopterin-dependent aromatic amino acid hydroxylase family profile domain-containing protein n=1 Tax=Collimonas fungivorans TaxID=158899 RepID=A0A127PH98_9BURK|nr:hypothetical protein CFter6_4598 [Collimonas fungivorans]
MASIAAQGTYWYAVNKGLGFSTSGQTLRQAGHQGAAKKQRINHA